jgi:hypothetical protein
MQAGCGSCRGRTRALKACDARLGLRDDRQPAKVKQRLLPTF